METGPDVLPVGAHGDGGRAEKLAYVVTLNTSADGTPDALVVLDTDPESPDFATVVGRLDMPNAGDELHHFGWNACSSALCPSTPHPHVERRYLLVPGLRSSRIHVIDVKDDPRTLKLVKVIEADEVARKADYSRPHTGHCGPEGVYMNGLGSPSGDGPGGIFLLDHDDFDVKGQWEKDRGPQYLAYDFWWHLGYDTMITSEWGTPNMVEGGLDPTPARPVRSPAPRLGPEDPQASAGHRPRARAADGARAAPGPQPEQGVRIRGGRRVDRRPFRVDLDLVQVGRRVGRPQDHHHPGRTG